ncbi:aminoimidazole riboside kinase [Vibrio palustris]|uniref:2-dehydro-3-deoxygluconokinase n=1 Tax=Vibrio palustris TaxID=1918946 RepID=A0A1R4B345_9VIBR|nr:aminoimidazole riboside kinase [Vibrio palustris]SJL83337.1 2-dehydro-3-deoxygluconokinase [Vibrio palustris]
MNRVWVTGDAVVDLIPDDAQRYLKCPGGAPANVAVGVARLGGNTAFFGRIGQDPFGDFLRTTLLQEQVNCEYLISDSIHRTSTVVVDLADDGERSFTFMVKPSADQFMTADDIPTFAANQWLHVCSIALANEPSRTATLQSMHAMKQANGYISFDPNLREEVWEKPDELIPTVMKAVAIADVVKFSEEELTFLTETDSLEQGLNALKHYHIPVVIVTQGAKGALVVHQQQHYMISGTAISPVDTTGAGDAFVGGLLSGLSSYDDWNTIDVIKEAVGIANTCGALATTAKGAMTALPNQQQLATYLR